MGGNGKMWMRIMGEQGPLYKAACFALKFINRWCKIIGKKYWYITGLLLLV